MNETRITECGAGEEHRRSFFGAETPLNGDFFSLADTAPFVAYGAFLVELGRHPIGSLGIQRSSRNWLLKGPFCKTGWRVQANHFAVGGWRSQPY
jgi:hypothetical protein